MTTQAYLSTVLDPLAEAINKVIAITNQKGGVGKTSTTFNFAHYLNELAYRVLVVDLDGQGNQTELFFEQDVLDQYVHTSAVSLFLEDVTQSFAPLRHPSGIHVVPTKRNSHEMNNVDTMDIAVAQTFYENLVVIGRDYDFIVIDTPPTPGVRTTAGCATADYIFAPVLSDIFAFSALEGLFNSINSIGEILGMDLKLDGVVINQWQDTGPASREHCARLAQAIGEPLIPTPIRGSKTFEAALMQGLPVWHLRKSGNEQRISRESRKAYGEMAARIAEIPQERIDHFNQISKAVRAKMACALA
jgi:chromosome partitioning protein